MNEQEMISLWQSHEDKLNQVLKVNKELLFEVTKNRLQQTIGKLRRPKSMMLILGIPYTLLMCFITMIALKAGGVFQVIGFGAITLLMILILSIYGYHLYLVQGISGAQDIVRVQSKLSMLRISSYNCARLAVLQLPFWVICWVSTKALWEAPLLYGGINLLLFLLFSWGSFWLYQQLDPTKPQTKVSRFFLSGSEWEPITKSAHILEQLKSMN